MYARQTKKQVCFLLPLDLIGHGATFLLQRRARSGNPDFFRVVLTNLHFFSLAVKNLALSQAALHWP